MPDTPSPHLLAKLGVDSAEGWEELLLPEIEWQRAGGAQSLRYTPHCAYEQPAEKVKTAIQLTNTQRTADKKGRK